MYNVIHEDDLSETGILRLAENNFDNEINLLTSNLEDGDFAYEIKSTNDYKV
jgi:hypothetical protein